MGNAESHEEEGDDYEDDDPHAGSGTAAPDEQHAADEATIQDDPFDGSDTLGYRVLGVQPDSPAAAAGLVSFLDFLVGCNGQMLLGSGEHLEPGEEYDDVDLPAVLEAHKGKELEFLVWNIKSQSARLVPLTPSDTWGGAGLLGVTIRLDDYAGAEDRLVRVLTVEPNSPAEIAGLQPETDFLLGTTHQTLDSVDRLAVAVLQPNMDRVVELYVYNTETDLVRVVALMPTYKWGGGRRGLLGAEVGTGYLHRLPFKTRDTSGSSVERKVRYVNVENSAEKRDNENNNNHKIQTPSSSSRRQLQPQLELEPQLEMEPGSDDDEVESVALTPASTAGKPTHEQKAPSVVEDRKMAAAESDPTYEQSQQQQQQQQQQRKAPPVAAVVPENTQMPSPNDYQRPQPAPNSAEALFKQPHRTCSSGLPQNNINQYQQQPQQPPQRTFSNNSSHNYYQQQQQQQAYEHAPPPPQHQQNPYSAGAAAPPPQRQTSYSAPQVASAVPTYQQKSSPQYAMQQQQQQASRQPNPYLVSATAPGVGPQKTNSGYGLGPPPQMSYYGGGGGAAPSYAGAGSASYGGGGGSSAALPPPPMRNQQQQQQQQLHPYGGAAPYSASPSS